MKKENEMKKEATETREGALDIDFGGPGRGTPKMNGSEMRGKRGRD